MYVSKEIISTIFSNAQTYFIWRFKVKLDFLVKLIGDKKVFENTIQTKEGSHTGMGSKKLQSTFKLSLESVRNLTLGECYFTTIRPSDKAETWPIKLKVVKRCE